MHGVTQLLNAIDAGDRQAAGELLPLVYDELRKLAAAMMAQEKLGQTLNATALVHEAYLRLVGDQQFENRGHFFGAAAQAMRRNLGENARRKTANNHRGQLREHARLPVLCRCVRADRARNSGPDRSAKYARRARTVSVRAESDVRRGGSRGAFRAEAVVKYQF